MSRKKQRIGIFDLGRIPLTPVTTVEPNYDRTQSDYRRRLANEEAQKTAAEQARFAKATAETGRILRQISDAQKELTTQVWGLPLDQLNDPQVRQQENAFDEFVGLEDGRFANQTVEAAFGEFLEQSIPLTGYALTEDGMKRLCWFGVSNHNRGKNLSTPEAWAKCFDRLLDCGAFTDGETVFHAGAKRVVERPRVESVEQPRKTTVDDLLACDDTREGQRRAREISNELWIEEWLPLAVDWTTSLQKHFGFTPTPDDLKKVSNWIEQNNLNRLDPRTYDAARRWMASQAGGYWTSALTSVEIHQREIEGADTSHMTVEQRRQWKVRAQQARESDIRRFGYAQ